MNRMISDLIYSRTGRVSSVLLAAALAFQTPLSTATITVDGSCSLADAITAANTDSATGGCVAGSGVGSRANDGADDDKESGRDGRRVSFRFRFEETDCVTDRAVQGRGTKPWPRLTRRIQRI